jgi:hypothetical protein
MMKAFSGKVLTLALAASFGVAGVAQAEVQDRVIAANVEPAILYQEIVKAATTMCNEADAIGEVVHVNDCVRIVVAKTVSEINRPSLTLYARLNTPTAASRDS